MVRTICAIALPCVVAGEAQAAAPAPNYPVRPIRMVVPFGAGGTFDLVARVVGGALGESLGQQVVADNRPGGGTVLATELVARANPDGHTLLMGSNALAINPALKSKLPYDTRRDLAPIALLATQPMAIGANIGFPATSVKQLVDSARASPGKITFASAGIGSGGHIAAELFKSAARIDLAHVGYKSGAQAMMDVIGNQVSLVFTGLPNVLPQARAGRLRILAITDEKRSEIAPEIPTAAETVPGYLFSNWFGVLAPAATPLAIQRRLDAELNRIVRAPEVRRQLVERGFGVIGSDSTAFRNALGADIARYAKVVKDAGISVSF